MAKVLLINGSGNEHGCTFTALSEAARALNEEGVETEIIQLGKDAIRDCIGCNGCNGKGRCVFDDDIVNEWINKCNTADGFIFGTPVYYAHPSGRILSAMDRLFYAAGNYFTHKPAAVIASARRGGTTATLDTLSKYFGIAQMPVISSTYWNMVHGNTPEQTIQDLEGMQTMRNIGKNMAWILKCIQTGKNAGIETPTAETTEWTNFIR